MSAGRPLKFRSPEELEVRIQEYFESCLNEDDTFKRPVTITGLALALNTTRELLCNYQERDEFRDTITRPKLMVEQFAEEQLYLAKSSSGPIFALKNFGWKDQQHTELSGPGGTPIETKHSGGVALTVDLQSKSAEELTRLFTEKLKG